MTIHLTFETFLNAFANEGQALYFIDNVLAEGRIHVSENTLPHYEFNAQALPPRFIAYSDYAPNVHSYSMRIERWYEDEDSSSDAIVTFNRSNGGLDWFLEHLWFDLQGVSDQSEMHWQDTPQSHIRRERDALTLQMAINEKRINRTRFYMMEKATELMPAQFESNCIAIAELRDLNNKAKDRIAELGY